LDLVDPLPGDPVLYPVSGQSQLTSRLVAAGELLAGFGHREIQYSHGAVLQELSLTDGLGVQFEAKFPKTGQFAVDTSRPYEIWNVAQPTDEQREVILRWCEAHVGDWYNLTGVLTLDYVRLPGTYYCSQFVGLAYAEAGITLGDSIMSPNSIPEHPGATKIYEYWPPGWERS
jgi:hypothetical protein